MIPYEELAAAIERWRIRNGLPVGEGGRVAAATIAAAAAAPQRNTPAAMPVASPRGGPPARAPAPAPMRPVTELPVDLGDADVLEEELYGSDQDLYGSGQAGYDDDAGEKTAIGNVPGQHPDGSPYDRRSAPRKVAPAGLYDQGRSEEDDALDALDAGADVIDESDDPDLR
jgi:hypothetical protein